MKGGSILRFIKYLIFSLIPAILLYCIFVLVFATAFSLSSIGYLLLLMILLTIIYQCFQRAKLSKQQKKRIIYFLLFYLYLCLMIHFLFLSSDFARDPTLMMNTHYRDALAYQWEHGTNFIPFETIKRMELIFDLDYIDDKIAIVNLLGNFIAFMPFSFFALKIFHKRFKHPITFMVWTSILIVTVELLQLFTLTGSCDVDDFILNFSGALSAYLILMLIQFLSKLGSKKRK